MLGKLVALILVSLALASAAVAHKGKDRGSEVKLETPPAKPDALVEINRIYLETVKPIFEKSCFACHSVNMSLPWYHSLPGARALIDHDITEAKEHLDFSNDFPFGGHGSPAEDLEALKKSVSEGTMPPLRYRALHWGSGLTNKESAEILRWIDASKTLLEQKIEPSEPR